MKKILSSSAVALVLLVSSCAKDKKFDDQNLGIANIEVKGVTFPQSKNLLIATTAADSISLATDVNSTTASQTISLITIGLESEFPSATDVTVSLALKPSLVPSIYSTLPAGTYSVPTTVKIPAGQKFARIPIVFSNTSTYSLTASYGLGITMTNVDGGYKVAANSKDIALSFNVKNQYDGRYLLKGIILLHPTYNGFTYTTDKIELRTAGSNSVNQFCTIWNEYCQPFAVTATGSLNRFGDLAPQYVVNPDNTVAVPAAGGPGNTTTMVLGPGGLAVNTYNPVTRTFYIQHGYLNAAGALRYWKDTLIYLGPR